MGQVVKPPASRVTRGVSERHRFGDAPILDAGYYPPSLRVNDKYRAIVHVVQVLAPLTVQL